MKTSLIWFTVVIAVGLFVSLALANPAMLPKHPGYPASKDVSPTTGQPLANDPGQTNATGEKAALEAAASEDVHSMQKLFDENNQRILKPMGAGLLPHVDGPDIKIEPPVKEATKVFAPAP